MDILDQVAAVNEFIQGFIAIEPVLILSVIVLVSLLSRLFKVREKAAAKNKEIILILMCFGVSGVISFLAIEPVESFRQVIRNAIVLGSVSTILYKIVKRAYKASLVKIRALLKKHLGYDEVDVDDNLLD